MDPAIVALAVAVLGTGGLTAVITAIIQSIRAARRGVAVREDHRASDIIKARDQAEAIADEAERRADAERLLRIKWQEHAARQRMRLINAGLEPDPWPDDPNKEN